MTPNTNPAPTGATRQGIWRVIREYVKLPIKVILVVVPMLVLIALILRHCGVGKLTCEIMGMIMAYTITPSVVYYFHERERDNNALN